MGMGGGFVFERLCNKLFYFVFSFCTDTWHKLLTSAHTLPLNTVQATSCIKTHVKNVSLRQGFTCLALGLGSHLHFLFMCLLFPSRFFQLSSCFETFIFASGWLPSLSYSQPWQSTVFSLLLALSFLIFNFSAFSQLGDWIKNKRRGKETVNVPVKVTHNLNQHVWIKPFTVVSPTRSAPFP